MRTIPTLGTVGIATLGLVTALAVGSVSLSAQEDTGKVYKFGTNTKHTNVTFVSEADVENIYGSTTTVSGQTWLDLDGGKGKTRITIPVDKMTTQIPLRDEHMRSEQWLDAAKFPNITFRSGDIAFEAKKKGRYEGKAKGKLTIHGVERDLEADVKIRAIPAKLAAKALGDGEWVRVTTSFDVKLSDFDIQIPEGQVAAKVSEVWQIKFDCYAVAGAKK